MQRKKQKLAQLPMRYNRVGVNKVTACATQAVKGVHTADHAKKLRVCALLEKSFETKMERGSPQPT